VNKHNYRLKLKDGDMTKGSQYINGMYRLWSWWPIGVDFGGRAARARAPQ